MTKFKNLIEKLSKLNSSTTLPNSSAEHAAIVMSKMFDVTNHSIKMLVGCFDGTVSDREGYKESLENSLLNKNIALEVLFMNSPKEDSSVYKMLRDFRDNKESKSTVQMKVTNENSLGILNNEIDNSGKEFHYAVFDDNKYRFEENIDTYEASFCFNDKQVAQRLIDVFNAAYNKSTPLP